ncbi:MAG: hypothetical protein J1F18_14255 [Lachnospiraceae bacterium]|nr:hypothetical protein [Lachnospiraceae bacterium]
MSKPRNEKQVKSNILTLLAQFQRTHWIFTLIFVNLSAVWLPILYTFLGVQLKLVTIVDQSSQFTPLGSAIMAVFLLIIFGGNGALIYDEKVNGKNLEFKKLEDELLEQKESGLVLRDLNSSANEICESKLSTLTDQLDFFITHSEEIPPVIISNPRRQLDSLAKELSICLAGLLKFQERRHVTELFTSIIYRFPEENDKDWHWATTERGLSISGLTSQQGGRMSTFQYLLQSKGHSVFKNSKQVAFDANQYIPDNEDEYDEDGKLKGSIACFQFDIKKNNKTIIEFVVSITSYAQQFVQGMTDGDEVVKNVRYNLERVVIPNYIVRAKIELCLLYIKYLNESRSSQ